MGGIAETVPSDFRPEVTRKEAGWQAWPVQMALHLAATGTESRPLFHASEAHGVMIREVGYLPQDNITGADTNTTHINLDKRDTAGDNPVEKANKDYTSGVNETDYNYVSLYKPTGGFKLVKGESLSVEYEKVGNGIIIPQLLWVVMYENILEEVV
jgi:hypothetical protein